MSSPILATLVALLVSVAVINCAPGKKLSTEQIPDDSIYQLSAEWTDQTGTRVTLSDFSGNVQIVGLIFTHCIAVCPVIVADMQAIERKIPWYRKDQIHFLLVTIDPKRDTPEVMARYMQKRQLDPKHWSFVTGTTTDTADLAALLGVKLQAQADGSFDHSRTITVLDPFGRITFQDPAITDGGQNFVRAAVNAL